MKTQLFRFAGLLFALMAMLLVLGSAAAQSPVGDDEDETATLVSPPGPTIDLATYPAQRWIVQLQDPPLATYRGNINGLRATSIASTGEDRLNPDSATSVAYTNYLDSQQRAFAQQLANVAPGAEVEQSYQVVLNGLAVSMSSEQAAVVRQMPGVRAVTPDIPFRLQTYGTPAQIGAPTLWGQVGGQANAGAGIKVAVIDSGIFVRYDSHGNYAGNPCFNDAGYSAPRDYPRGDTRFTNNKVLVARAYFRPYNPPLPGDDTPIQGPKGDPHGTHTSATVGCNANTPVTYQGAKLNITGIAPRAYLMNYRVFYPCVCNDFFNGNAFVVELAHAIEDAVKDGADVVSNSWGSSYQNTLAWPDPMVQAAEAAVDAGVVMVFANGNSGPDNGTTISPALAPKVIGVGAVTKNSTIVPGDVDVTAPAPVPGNLKAMPVGPALFGPVVTGRLGPAAYVPAEKVATNASSLGCSLSGDASPYPAGSMTGKIAVIQRGICTFSEKIFNAQRAGAVAGIIYNSSAGGDNIQAMGPGAHAGEVKIPSWFMRRSQGLAMVAYYNSNPGTAQAQFTYGPHVAGNIGDVMAGFSSRGPTQDKLIKPDVVAPGVDVLSAGYGVGLFPQPFIGFGAVSGTSMATPHVAGSAALLKQLHPNWRPWQIKSALMHTATEDVFLNTTLTSRAGVLDRGAGRIDLTKAGNPGLTLDPPSLSAGELIPGQGVIFNIRAQDVSGAPGTWNISTTGPVSITLGSSSLTVPAGATAFFTARVYSSGNAAAGGYQGSVLLTNSATGVRLHIPVWLRVIPTATTATVLLVDDDGSSADPSFRNYSAVYTSTLQALGISYRYLDIWTTSFPSLNALFGYKAVLIFTGDNDDFATSGFFDADLDRLTEWLDSGGRLWTTGQNFAETNDNNFNFDSPNFGRSRLYHGYLGLEYVMGSVYSGSPPRPTAEGVGPMSEMAIDLSVGGDGAGNQASVEASRPIIDTDTYAASNTMTLFFRQRGGNAPHDSGISFGRSSEPSLEEGRLQYRYRSASMGFGLEGVNNNTGFTTRQELARRTLSWLLDTISAKVAASAGRADSPVTLTAQATSSVGASFTQFRWDFGDGSPFTATTTPSVQHQYSRPGHYTVRVEVTDSLGHRAIAAGLASPTTAAGDAGQTIYLPLMMQ